MTDLTNYGYKYNSSDYQGHLPARITEVHRERYHAVCDYGEVGAVLKGSLHYRIANPQDFPVVGDFVLLEYNAQGESRIVELLPRHSFFSRRAAGRKPVEQPLAANFDYALIVQSINQNFNIKRLERYLALAWQSGAVPVVVLTKADLVEDYSEYLSSAESCAIGVEVVAVSAKTGEGMERLTGMLPCGSTVVFLGSSGVGKSSLINAMAGKEVMAVSEIREDDSRGRHTTTHRQLILLDSGVMVIDTPGMRELGIWDASEGVNETFDDVTKYFGQCRFVDCGHTNEPDCAIQSALAAGELSAARWKNYLKLKREGQYADDKIAYMRQKSRLHKDISKNNHKKKKEGKMKIELRQENENDYAAVEMLTRQAFWGYFNPTCDEHYLVHLLHKREEYVPELSYVAEVDGELAGSIIYSRAKIRCGATDYEVLTFGPLSVIPRYRNFGVGKRLVQYTANIAHKLGYRAIVIYGHPNYYPRFGYRPASEYGITEPGGKCFDALMAMPLYEGALDNICGTFHESEVFNFSAEDAKAFDGRFPVWEPAKMPPVEHLLAKLPPIAAQALAC